MFTRTDERQDVNVGDPDCPMERLQDEFEVDIIISHLNDWQFFSSALKSVKDRDIYFRVNSPWAAWRSLVDVYSLEAQGASVALLLKIDSVRIGTNDDPILKLLEMEDIPRSLCLSHSQWQHLTELYVIGKFVNALPREYDIQKHMLEEIEDGFPCEAVISSVQKWFELYTRTSSCAAASQSQRKFKLSRSPAGVRITPAAVDLVTAVESPADYSAAAETMAAVGPRKRRLEGGGTSGRGVSSGSSSTPTAKAGGRTCWVCKSDQHYVRDCPKQICQGCGERGHCITICRKTENAVRAVDMVGRTSTDDNSLVCSEAKSRCTPSSKARQASVWF